jgi:hypothetical protein
MMADVVVAESNHRESSSRSGEAFCASHWLCVSRVAQVLKMGSRNDYPPLLVPPSIEVSRGDEHEFGEVIFWYFPS